MQPEQQQRIMGYFIEEAKDHLNTIEQGLLSLQSTIEDTEMMNEVFRAAHSVKGGAGMLGINSIHKTAHRLEDYLKFLQESPVKVDAKLETLFLQVFDTLEGLVEQLQSPFGLTDETASGIMSDATPVFEQLNTHLEQLIRKTASAAVVGDQAAKAAQVYGQEARSRSVNVQPSGKNANVLPTTFKRDVLVQLREMLQIFKQQDLPAHREQLQAHCRSLESIGEAVDLPGWGELLETSRFAIAHSDNSYRQLAGLVIKEIKQAQELALANRSVEIAPSTQLKAMVPISPAIELEPEVETQDLEKVSSTTLNPETIPSSSHNGSLNTTATTSLNSSESSVLADSQTDASPSHFSQDLDLTPDFYYTNRSNHAEGATSQASEMSDPEVGIAELNSLADIFEGQTPDLEQTWQEEEIINLNESHDSNSIEELSLDDSSDLSDLMGDLNNFELTSTATSKNQDDLARIDDEKTNHDSLESPAIKTIPTNSNTRGLDSDFSDLLFESDHQDQRIIGTTEAEELNNLFGDSFFEESQDDDTNPDFEFDAEGMLTSHETPDQPVAPINLVNETNSSLDHISPDHLFDEAFTNQENGSESWDFDSSNLFELEDLSSEQSLFEALDITPTQPTLTDSELNDNWLDLPNSDAASSTSAAPEELLFDDEAIDFGIEELTFDDADNLDLSGTGDFSLEDLLGSDQQNIPETTIANASQASSLFFEDEPETSHPSALNLDIDELWNLDEEPQRLIPNANSSGMEALPGDFDFDDSSNDLFNFDQEDHGSTDNLFADELSLSAQTAAFDQNNFDELFPQTTQTTDLDAVTFEGIDLASLEGTEIEDFDVFNNFFDADAEEPSSLESLSEFDDFSRIEAATTSSENGAATAQNGYSELLPQQDTPVVAAQFDLEPTEDESIADLSEFLFDGEAEQTDQVAVDDLDLLLGENSQESELLNFEAALFALDASAQEQNAQTVSPASLPQSEATDELDALLSMTADSVAIPVETELASELDDDLFNWDSQDSADDATSNLDDWLNESADPTPASLAENLELESDEAATVQVAALTVTGLGASIALASQTVEFDDLDALLTESETLVPQETRSRSQAFAEFDDLDALLGESELTSATASTNPDFESFDDLDALLNLEPPAPKVKVPAVPKSNLELEAANDEFGDLEQLLEQAYKTMGGPPTPAQVQGQPKALSRPRPRVFEQTMRVPVKHLDSLSNLVGELVVNRNSLEQDQERLRQFLDNLSHQVLALSDVGSRMQDLYERSLLESSLLASRHPYRTQNNNFLSASSSNHGGVEYDPLEMDRFTGFHLLSQEMIELIVRVRESASDIEFLVDETDQVARMLRQVTTQLQEGLTRSRMVPFAQTADRLPRAVRDISQKLRKEAQLYVEGRETLIDKMILEHLSDPMTHLINNALTHGIETPEIRRAAGKSATGKITLKAFHQGNQTVISVSDDGAGIDPERVRAKAVERRLISAADATTLTNLDLYNFLFHPGFTTKDKEDEYAGRGVGMDVVLTSMSEIRGTVHIDSTLGKGTTFTIRLPLTLSICKALCCLSDRARIAFPMDGVEDMLDLPSDRVQLNSDGQTCIQWREALLPFQSLSKLLKYNRQLSRGTVYGGKREDDMISIVVLRSAGNFIAIQVDQVLGEQEIVIKQLEGPAPKPVGIAGATVLGDGRIMPIADVLELIDLAMGRIRKDNVSTLWSREDQDGQPEDPHITKTEPMVLIVDDSITVRELLSMTFSKSGYRVEQARDGQEAWDKLRSGLPCDIVFCDIEMPRMDGLELLSRLQKDENLCHLPIAMLTSRGADRHRQMASQLGANGYFTKPYLEEVLLEAAQRMIKGEVLFGSNSTSNLSMGNG
jgi:chemotaxis protein histidine kinase CheA/ActR/RegA family two-component response regulator